jgi:hypothetical protein
MRNKVTTVALHLGKGGRRGNGRRSPLSDRTVSVPPRHSRDQLVVAWRRRWEQLVPRRLADNRVRRRRGFTPYHMMTSRSINQFSRLKQLQQLVFAVIRIRICSNANRIVEAVLTRPKCSEAFLHAYLRRVVGGW